MLEVSDLSFKRDKRELFKSLNFTLEKGEILSVLGQNGVGKTTLLRCLMGFLKAKGSITYMGKDLKHYSQKELFKLISYVPQSKNSAIGLSVLDMVLLGLNTTFSPSNAHKTLALETLESLEIANLKDKKCNALSGGELQMVLLARAIICKPQIIILDEPESNLDFKNISIILHLLKRLQDSGVSIILNTHFPMHALILKGKTLMLKKDTSYIYGLSDEVLNESNLSFIYEVSLKRCKVLDLDYIGF
ncbi:ABC transporter ATP-binding protein [Helicobacter sp. 13S00401-1]|uniref:ABC transporter ATP-binding protein n=1 Tax=Helicobacter sp. 13S00401-1 TaxID=1905758 RepID=UPI00209C4974|nr:ABC transporter ATP-binding protein [Helicobacter sp. 13S00401-1]